jgi:hypothetical protein
MEQARLFSADFLSGRFADAIQPDEARGEELRELIGDDDLIVHEELNRLNTAVIAWIAKRDLGEALRQVRSDSHLATHNVGFSFESDFFRLASYDWSEDEDENGDLIVRHNFECKPSGTCLDWYKWAGRDDWASKGLAEAMRVAEEKGIPLYAWWERVVDACIDSLLFTEDAEFRRIESCGWRHLDEGAIPHGIVQVEALIGSPEVDSVTLSHREDGYVGFKEFKGLGDSLPPDAEDVSTNHPDIVAELEHGAADATNHPLRQSISLDGIECPDDVGYIVIGGRVFRRLVLDAPRRRDLIADDGL